MNDGTQLSKFVAPEVVTGAGAHRLAGRTALNLGARTVLLVSDPGVAAAGWTAAVAASLAEAGLRCVTFDGVRPNTRSSEVAAGAACYVAQGCNALVAVGGGSVIDCAKGIGIVACNGGDVVSYEGIDEIPIPIPPLVCVPTTAGSAADVSQFAIILDEAARTKLTLVSKALVPDVSLIDPLPLTTQPRALTVATGIDALSHAVEALCSTGASPLTDLFALDAIRRVVASLPGAVERPGDLEARSGTMFACLHAGLAFSNASLGATHALSHALGGLSDAPHGECNAILLPHVVRYNFPDASRALRRVGEILGLDLSGRPDPEARDLLCEALDTFLVRVGAPRRLSALGISHAEVAALAEKALEDPCMATNPRCPVSGDMEALLEAAI